MNEEIERLRDGSTVRVRPITPADAGRLDDGFQRLSPQSRYRRFHAPMRRLSSSMLHYLTHVDHHDHEAFVALGDDGETMAGVARYIRHRTDPAAAEVAVTVVDDWQGRGLGRRLLERLADRAREEGVDRFTALVQPENARAAELLRRLGPARSSAHETGVQLDIDLEPRPAGLEPVRLDFELPAEGLGARLDGTLRAAARSLLSAPWYPHRLLELLDALPRPFPDPLLRRLGDAARTD